jgi:hypothetical protein
MIEVVQSLSHSLKSFSSSAVTFATADNSISATGIGTDTVEAGEKFTISGAGQTGNNRTFTAVTVSANKIVVEETVAAESPGSSVVLNEEYIGSFKDVSHFSDLMGSIAASQNCTGYVDFSNDKENVDYTATVNVTGGTPAKISEGVVAYYARLRVRNGGTSQTSLRANLNGKR